MFLTNEKQTEIRKLMIQMAEGHVSRANEYKVEFLEEKGNAITNLFAAKGGKEILHITNVMTKAGFDDLERLKGWTAWALGQVKVLKQALQNPPKKKSWIKRFLNKILR